VGVGGIGVDVGAAVAIGSGVAVDLLHAANNTSVVHKVTRRRRFMATSPSRIRLRVKGMPIGIQVARQVGIPSFFDDDGDYDDYNVKAHPLQMLPFILKRLFSHILSDLPELL
jgi:hypothetical protein